jgi:hypothetical protein
MVLASQMASGSIKNGWLIAQVNLWLLWNNISAYQLYSPTGVQFMLVWLLPYKENVDLISVASSKDTRSVWALLLIFASTPSKKVDQSFTVLQVLVFHAGCRCLIVCRNSCWSIKGYDQLEMERGPRAHQHLHFGGLEDLTMLHQLGIFTDFSDSVDTYWTPHDIKYTVY